MQVETSSKTNSLSSLLLEMLQTFSGMMGGEMRFEHLVEEWDILVQLGYLEYHWFSDKHVYLLTDKASSLYPENYHCLTLTLEDCFGIASEERAKELNTVSNQLKSNIEKRLGENI